jgi:hypothetical protein
MTLSQDPITPYEFLSLIISIAGFLMVITTLIFLARQTREMTKQSKFVAESLRVSIYQGNESRSFEVDEIFINHPELRPYFYLGQDIEESDPAYNKVIAIADLMLDFLDSILLQPKFFGATFVRDSWGEVIADIFANSPILCRHLQSIKDWHSDELQETMKTGEARRQHVNEQRNSQNQATQ